MRLQRVETKTFLRSRLADFEFFKSVTGQKQQKEIAHKKKRGQKKDVQQATGDTFDFLKYTNA